MRASTNLDQIRLPNNHNPPLHPPQQPQQMNINQQQLIDSINNMSLGGGVPQAHFIPQNAINGRVAASGTNPAINLAVRSNDSRQDFQQFQYAANGSQNMVMPQQHFYNGSNQHQQQVPQMHGTGYFQNMMPISMIGQQQQQQNKSMTSRAGDQQYYNGLVNRPHSAFTNMSNADISLQNDIWAPGTNNQSTSLQGINRRLFSSPAPQGQHQQQVQSTFQQIPQQVNNAAPINFNNDEGIKQQPINVAQETANADSIFSRPPCEGFGTEPPSIQPNSLQGSGHGQQLLDERYLPNGQLSGQQQQAVNQVSQLENFHYLGGQPQTIQYLQGINGHHHAQSQQVLLLPPNSNQVMKGQSSEVFSANVNKSGSITQRGATSFRTGPRQKSNEVMIHNIDKATISFIAQELHQQDVLDISQSLVSRNILIVRFQNCDGAQWAINRYDGQTINQRELRVTIAVDGPHRNRKREVKWESTNLAKITETADVDEDLEQESSAENINTQGYSSPQQLVHGQAPQDNLQTKSAKQVSQNGYNEPQSKAISQQALVVQTGFSDQGFIPQNRQNQLGGLQLQNSITPPPGLSRMDQQLTSSAGLSFPPGFMMQQNQIQQHAMLQRSYPGNNFDKMMMQQQMQQQRFYQNGSQLMPNSQPLQFAGQSRQMASQAGFYPENHPQFQNQGGNPYHSQQVGGGPQQFQPNHYMTQTLNQQDFMMNPQVSGPNAFQNQTAHMTLDPSSLQKAQGIDPQNFKEVPGMLGMSGHSRSSSTLEPISLGQDLSVHFKDQNFQQPQQQFGFAPLQHMLHIGDIGQFNQMLGIPQNFSSSIETSQQDDIDNLSSQNINFPENHGSGSDRESFIFRNNRLSMTTRNVMISNSTRNSDSDSSQKFNKLQFHQTQQFQSPESRRRAMQQIYQETSFEYHRNPASNSGHDTPPFLTPAQNKHLNNSFNQMNGGGNSSQGQSQTLFVNEAHQRMTHNRNLSLNSQLPSQLLNQDPTTQFFMQQHGHHQTQFYISSGAGGHPQLMANLNCGASSSSDLNDINNFYPIQQYQGGGAFLPHQTAASQLGPELRKLASDDFDNHSEAQPKQKKKGGNASSSGNGQGGPQNKSYQSHKSLKYQTYSEWSLTSDQSMYELDLEKIKRNEDMRTTVMIKHIPNKYNQRLLLQEINKNHQGKYDFFYLPIDYQNSANVGYAFVNFVHHYMILDFQKEFQGRKWAMFNSKKKCDIKYGRIQGLENLKQHFHQSSVMNQNDENFRPRIFEQHNKMDWTAELKKIIEKHKIQNPMFHKCAPGVNIQSHQSLLNLQQQQSNITSNQSQGSHAQGSHHNRQHSIGGSSSNNPHTNSASQAALSTQKLIEASAEEEEEKEEP